MQQFSEDAENAVIPTTCRHLIDLIMGLESNVMCCVCGDVAQKLEPACS